MITATPTDEQAWRSVGKDAAVADRPNIIFFIVDDLGWQDTSVAFWERPTEFQKHFRTPNLQRLAENGMRFSCAHACAVCTPTRVSILTGQNAARHCVTNWILRTDQETSGKTERLEAPRDWRRAGTDAVVTLPKILRRQGYATIHCGKAHWGAVGTPASDPKNLGFDVNIAGHAAGAPGSYQGMKNFGNAEQPASPRGGQAQIAPETAQIEPVPEHRKGQTPIAPKTAQLASDPGQGDQSDWGVPGLEKYFGTETHLTDALAEEAVSALDRVPRDQPVFLYFAPYAVHTPIEPHERFMADYAGRNYADTDRSIPPVEAQYASMVAGVDAALGRLIAKLEEQGNAERTIIVFTLDNGGLSAHARGLTPRGTERDTHCWPLRAGKGSAYEGGTRVPLVIAWAKSNPKHPLQQAIPIASGPRGDGYQPHSAMQVGELKIIYFYEPHQWELYDLQTDIGESRDLAATEPKKLKELAASLIDELREKGALYPMNRETGEAEPPVMPGEPK